VSTALLISVVTLTVVELAAVVVISVFGPKDTTTALVAVLVGIVGPVVTSLVALVRAGEADAKSNTATAQAEKATERANQAATAAGVPEPPGAD
jgi:hypothetical protein